MPPVSKVLGNDAKVDPFMIVKWYMLMHVVQDWHTKLTAVSGDMRRSEEKTTKDMMSFAHQLMMMMKMLKANSNDIGRLQSRLAVIEGTPTPSPTLSPMRHSPLGGGELEEGTCGTKIRMTMAAYGTKILAAPHQQRHEYFRYLHR